jgi:hypothetical protein
MTAEESAAIGTLVAQASIIKDQVAALGIQVEAFEQQAKALGRKLALETKGEAPPVPAQPEKPRHYGPRRT